MRRSLLCLVLACSLLLASGDGGQAKTAPAPEFDTDRNRLIAFILSQQLPAQHFSHEPLGDELSRKMFDLYLRQLDPRKRFLLQADVRQLNAFAPHVDDELKQGKLVLPDAGRELLNDRIRLVQRMIDPILDAGFAWEQKETLEVEPKKLDYAADAAALRERWRLTLKMQVLDSYFDALDSKRKENPKAGVDIAPARHAAELGEAVKKVRASTHRALTRLLQQSRQDHYDRYFDAVARAFDPHTDYMAPASKEDFDIQMSGSLEGIGALLREDEGLIKVIRVIPGSAAAKQGQLQAEDTILSVAEKDGDPVDIAEMRIREAVGFIRGPKGTEVRLTVQKPDGRKMVIPIIRDVVQIEETYVKGTVLRTERKQPVGYLRIPSFYRDFAAQADGEEPRNVTDDTIRELARLQKQRIGGLILDLRNNGGGALTDAVQISGLFLPGGPVVQVKDSQGTVKVLEDDDASVHYDGPMIVLVNQFSASASEILAAALQDYGRALIVGGDHTHGKGTVQAMLDMNRNLPLLRLQDYEDLGALKLTIQKFYRISGGSTQYKGVEPDLVVPSLLDYLESGEKYMDYSLPWDQVGAVDFEPWQGYRFDVAKARREGGKWAADNPLFDKIREETAKAKARSEETTLPVSLQGMWQDREELAATRKEAQAIGLLQEGEEEGAAAPEEKKPLEETLGTDPVVQVSLFLMRDLPRPGRRIGLSQ
ncbi:carboxy terminal-processing peptidase [uncultured Desulfobulbus sp.]|uniref:carboxy terminal-processing peptidase n=1 Tax=uncultured Desulfobulbus sp. TaxID=239745 RepID=UPI0026143026|nr:carboxy terminal-processing peptidase [uncultured Desulfobulbus sp.]